MTTIFLDTETTGDAPEDRVLQLAYLLTTDTGVICKTSEFQVLCKPPVPVKPAAMAVHHITPDMLETQRPLVDTREFNVLQQLNTPANLLVIQKADFDLDMLAKDGFISEMQLIDTLKVAQHTMQEQDKHGLQFLRYDLGLYKKEAATFGTPITAHDALGDVRVLYLLFHHFLEQGFSIDDMIDLTKKPVLHKYFNFGKFRGKKVEDCLFDKQYFGWCLKNMENLSSDWKYTLTHYLG